MRGTLIALDWGTTHVRAALLDGDGAVLEERHGESGVGQFTEAEFAARFAELTHGWADLPALAAGMVGSKQGWQEATYLPCPTGLDGLASSLTPVDGQASLQIVPGLKMHDESTGRHDVMRGEESQIAGLLAHEPDYSGTIVLPGSHCKWVHMKKGEIVHFTTYMTGELFAAMAEHTMLRPCVEADESDNKGAFQQGVADIFTSSRSAWSTLFDLRGRSLLAGAHNGALRERLSGLLIGMELEAAARDGYDVQAFTLIGSASLTERYQRAGSVLQADMVTYEGTDLIWPALMTIARRAKLI